MDHDQVFRLIIIGGLVVVVPIGIYHRLKSQRSGEKLDRSQEGRFILFTLRPIAFLGIASLIAWLINPAWMSWSAVSLPIWLRWTGIMFGIGAAGLMTWVFRSIGTNITDTVVTRKHHELVTSGPYRWVRHPLYSATALTVIASSLTTASWFLAMTGAMAFALIMIRTAKEEDNLIERFGDQYKDYMKSTGKLFPKIR